MKVGKPKSKRTPIRLRHKIEKASAAKQRKDRKLAKKNPQWRSKLKKDPGIPNLFPFKDKILQEIEETKRRRDEERLRRREEEAARRNGAQLETVGPDQNMDEEEDYLLDLDDDDEQEQDDEDDDASANPMAALLASARARASEFDRSAVDDDQEDDEMEEDGEDNVNITGDISSFPPVSKDSSQRAHDKAFKSVIATSDVLLYVLDARDPMGTRSAVVEQAVTASPDKRLILILNKIDLVPPQTLKAWLAFLRRSFPTLPLRATSSASNAQTFNHKILTIQRTSLNLIKALKAYSSAQHTKRAIVVGIIGYPNVGKSSAVNALTSRLGGSNRKQSKDCPVGAEAGVTTALREVKLDGKLKLIDSPGIVFPSTNPSSSAARSKQSTSVEEQARLILLNAIPPKDITDPLPAVTLLLSRLSATPELYNKLLEVYDLPPLLTTSNFVADGVTKDKTTDFLLHVARKRGRLGKGGVPNLHAAAQTVLTDWRDGRIQGWCEPPTADEEEKASSSGERMKDKKEIVTEWSKEFKIEGLWGDDEDGEAQEAA